MKHVILLFAIICTLCGCGGMKSDRELIREYLGRNCAEGIKVEVADIGFENKYNDYVRYYNVEYYIVPGGKKSEKPIWQRVYLYKHKCIHEVILDEGGKMFRVEGDGVFGLHDMYRLPREVEQAVLNDAMSN